MEQHSMQFTINNIISNQAGIQRASTHISCIHWLQFA